jgi:signal transduction histidine kinase
MIRPSSPRRLQWTWAALGITATLLTSSVVHRYYRIQDEQRFDRVVSGIHGSILGRISRTVDALVHTHAFFAANKEVTRESFRSFVEAAGLISNDRLGMQGVGYSVFIPGGELKRHLRKMRSSGFPNYRVWPESPRENYFAVQYLEPFDWRNQRAFGYDIHTEPVRARAMDQAELSGSPAITGKVTLVQETDKDRQPGFLIFVPVFRRGLPTDTPEQRRKAFTGLISAPYRAHDFIRSSVNLQDPALAHIQFEVYDGTSIDPAHLLFDRSEEPGRSPSSRMNGDFTSTATVEVLPGSSWTIRITALPGFSRYFATGASAAVALAGIVLTLLLIWNARLMELERAASRQREEILGIVSHDLKNPLTNILLGMAVFEQTFSGHERESKLKEQTQRITRAALWMQKLIENLLDAARIDARQLQLKIRPVNLGQMIQEVMRLQAPLASEQSIVLELANHCGDLEIPCDPDRIQQALINLIGNALKFSPHGGRVRVECSSTTHHGRQMVQLTVEDHGPGIAPEEMSRLFERFWQCPETVKKGNGLGLAIAKGIVEAHRGEISVESTIGQGSTFKILLPA